MSAPQESKVTQEEVEGARAWVHEMYRLADTKNAVMVPTFMHEETVLNFASTSSLKGRAALERLYTWEYGACARIDHSIQEIRVSRSRIYVNLSALYRFKNGSSQKMDYRAVWYKTPLDQRAWRVDISGDFSKVFAELTAVAGPPPL
ncbi:hypothetical protein HYPSUDRAFT_211491 [Hypholoma sublateritium FD-334 SS-4]|uniref:DUF4440 domain-containing protein n=1 Tax=Hypholoma sublateritium (strain FD-334 SS-4) TaxID=945553 RepID=A0A0D2PKC4_HYPSF|nr:hypothetical protein HYPSUDRAFT_211491 [Hypholoma sublateritium FD-334 SS-4]